jgi:hypothetical protein
VGREGDADAGGELGDGGGAQPGLDGLARRQVERISGDVSDRGVSAASRSGPSLEDFNP